MAQKPSIPKGTRDFSPVEMNRRNYIFDTIKGVYKKYGYMPIETPAMENLSTLMGKYGEEGDKLLFKTLNSGDFMSKVDTTKELTSSSVISKISERGLRYDLTVPFARYVVQHRNDITFPFKRYQIQPVWRADRPQKGRYREFFQCDADVIGSKSLFNEVELIQIIDEVFQLLKINVAVKLNNRKILAGIAEYIGEPEKIIDITVAIDKLDKIGREKVEAELQSKDISAEAISKLSPLFESNGSNDEKLVVLDKMLSESEIGLQGVNEIRTTLDYLKELNIKCELELDLTLARGLNYYTGAIIEVKALDVKIGSICGGGRYDNLTGIFGLADVSGVGISFGADRIYDVMLQEEIFPEDTVSQTDAIFINFGDKEAMFCIKQAALLRKQGIKVEVYPDSVKLKKQMTYANNKSIKYVMLVGENEMINNEVTVKNMTSGEQSIVSIDKLVETLV